MENLKKRKKKKNKKTKKKTIGFIAIGNDWDSYFEYIEFSTLATILDAILDFSVYHQLYQFILAVSDTTDHAEHFGI